jgi:hypothetical protein
MAKKTKKVAPRPITVRASDGTKFVMLNDAFSSGHYVMLKQTMAKVLGEVFNLSKPFVTVEGVGVGNSIGSYHAHKNALKGISIGCKVFNQNDTRKIAKWTGVFTYSLDCLFPKAVVKAKAARAGR